MVPEAGRRAVPAWELPAKLARVAAGDAPQPHLQRGLTEFPEA